MHAVMFALLYVMVDILFYVEYTCMTALLH